MRFDLREKIDPLEWHPWFAWRPVQLCDEREWKTGVWVWLERVERKIASDPYAIGMVYRTTTKTDAALAAKGE